MSRVYRLKKGSQARFSDFSTQRLSVYRSGGSPLRAGHPSSASGGRLRRGESSNDSVLRLPPS